MQQIILFQVPATMYRFQTVDILLIVTPRVLVYTAHGYMMIALKATENVREHLCPLRSVPPLLQICIHTTVNIRHNMFMTE